MSTLAPRTHEGLDPELCGTLVELGEGTATVAFTCTARMAADGTGLVHGGFTFGLADHAAMLAVNEPTVVLGGAEVRFLKPTRVGDRVEATARVTETKGRKRIVEVSARCGDDEVMAGTLTCFVPDLHVLTPPGS